MSSSLDGLAHVSRAGGRCFAFGPAGRWFAFGPDRLFWALFLHSGGPAVLLSRLPESLFRPPRVKNAKTYC